MTAPFHHIPIMVEPVLALLAPERGGIFVDGTLGGGGHAEAVLSRPVSYTHLDVYKRQVFKGNRGYYRQEINLL